MTLLDRVIEYIFCAVVILLFLSVIVVAVGVIAEMWRMLG